MPGSLAPGAHGCLFLAVGKISISAGMSGFGHREVGGRSSRKLLHVCEGMWLRVVPEELLHVSAW